MDNQLQKTYLGREIVFTPDGWINASQTCKTLDKKGLENFVRSKAFDAYKKAYCKFYSLQESDVIKTVRGDTVERRGIFLHPGLAIVFARWINPHFAVWCDSIITQILTGSIEIRYKELQQDFEQLEAKHDKLFEELKLYQRPDEENDTPQI